MTQRVIDLDALANSRSAEIDRMADGIRGEGNRSLWTLELRATTRGGKCPKISVDDEASS
jgi:hypothetical protein